MIRFIFIFFMLFTSVKAQDTIQLSEVLVYAQQKNTILKQIKKNFKEKFVQKSDKMYHFRLNSVCNDEKIFSIDEKSAIFENNFFKTRKLSSKIEEKLKTDYFSNKNYDAPLSPEYIITKSPLYFIKLDTYISKIKIEKIVKTADNFEIFGNYGSFLVEITAKSTNYDVISIKMYQNEPYPQKYTHQTKGTKHYLNLISEYKERIITKIDFLSDENHIFLSKLENKTELTDYSVKLYEHNRKNKPLGEHLFTISSELYINSL